MTRRWSRRTLLGALAAGLAVHLTGYARQAPAAPPRASPPLLTTTTSPTTTTTTTTTPTPTPTPTTPTPTTTAVTPGSPVVLTQGPAGAGHVALTIDDGYAEDVVAGYVAFAQRTGIHLTFSPNSMYAPVWNPHAPVLRPLVETGQVQIVNHTARHLDLTTISAGRLRRELEENEAWVNHTFATSTRPYLRPPYGAHSEEVDRVAADSGFDRVVLWNGSYGDSGVVTPGYLLDQARRYFTPGTIMLGHANHPTVVGVFDQLAELLRERGLRPVTLDEMFGTRRPPRS